MSDIIGVNVSLVKGEKHVHEWNTVYIRGRDVIVLSNIPEMPSKVEFDNIEIEFVGDVE